MPVTIIIIIIIATTIIAITASVPGVGSRPCGLRYHTMRVYGAVKVKFHSFLPSVLDFREWLAVQAVAALSTW